MFDLSIVIPCYNEGKNINHLYKKLIKLKNSNYKIEIILVDNGSNDNSENIIQSLIKHEEVFKYIKIKKNIGYGNGIIAGINEATGNYISWTHADLQTNPEDIFEGLNIFYRDSKEKIVVKGRRINRSIIDKIFTVMMSLIASIIFGYILKDINAQPKIFHKSFLKYIKEPPNDFSLDLFFLIIAKKNGYKICDFPVNYYKRNAGEAKGGGGNIKNKIKLTLTTLKYIYNLKKNISSYNIR